MANGIAASCTLLGPAIAEFDENNSGNYAVDYSVETEDASGGNIVYGAESLIALAQGYSPHPLPKKEAIYDYDGTLGAGEIDAGSKLYGYRVNFTPDRRSNAVVTCLYRRSREGEPQRVDGTGNPLVDPVYWEPVYTLRHIKTGYTLEGGWPRVDLPGGPTPSIGYAPVTGDEPLSAPFGSLKPIKASVDPLPITAANKLTPSQFPRVQVDQSVLVCRLNFDSLERFNLEDSAARLTVYNGGDDWTNNGGQDANPKTFFGHSWGLAAYDGGRIIGERQFDAGYTYYVGEFRFLLYQLTPAVARVRNESKIKWNGSDWEPIVLQAQGRDVLPGGPLPLDIDGDYSNSNDLEWLEYWYGRPYDYGAIGNGVHTVGYDWPETAAVSFPRSPG